jgi:predicted phosphohydrolase
MRIVAVADTHTFENELGPVPDGDLFVHAGDLLRRGTLDELAPVAAWIRSLPHPFKVVVAGNHDWAFISAREAALDLLGPDVIYLEDSTTTIAGLRFWGSPWQPEYNSWAFNLPRGARLAERWAAIPAETDVLITHGPPRGYGDTTSVAGRQGCDDLLAAIDRVQPALHLFGHIHQDGGFCQRGNISLANVTTWECERPPTILDIDTTSKVVRPVAIPPAKRAG